MGCGVREPRGAAGARQGSAAGRTSNLPGEGLMAAGGLEVGGATGGLAGTLGWTAGDGVGAPSSLEEGLRAGPDRRGEGSGV